MRLAVAVMAWILFAMWFQLTRGPGHATWNTIWAEDFGVLLQNALQHSLWHNVSTPYVGYLQLAPRLLAQPEGRMPLEWAAAWTAVTASALVVGCSLVVWNRSAVVLRSALSRAVVIAIIPLLPQAGSEVNAALIDAHWYLDIALFWVMAVPPRSLRGQLGAASLAVAAALSDPLAVVALVPAAAVLLRERRWRIELLAVGALVGGLAVQGWVHLHEATFRLGATEHRSIPEIVGLRVVLNALLGERGSRSAYVRWGAIPVVLAVVLFMIVVGVLARHSEPGHRFYAATLLLGAVVFVVLELQLRGTAQYLSRIPFATFPSRYWIVPIVLLWTGMTFLADGERVLRGIPIGSAAAVGLTVLVAVEIAVGYAAPTNRTAHPTWTANLRRAESLCALPPERRGVRLTAAFGEHVNGRELGIPVGPDDVSIQPDGVPGRGHRPIFALVLGCERFNR